MIKGRLSLIGIGLLLFSVIACDETAETNPTATPDIEATVHARIVEKQAEEALLEEKAWEIAESMMQGTAEAMPTQIPTRPPTLTPTHTPVPTKVPTDPRMLIQQALSNLVAVGSYELEVYQEVRLRAEGLAIDVPTEWKGDVANNEDFTGIQTTWLLGEAIRADVVILEGILYFKQGDSYYWDSVAVNALLDNPVSLINMDTSLLQKPKLIGTETIDGMEHYQIEVAVSAAAVLGPGAPADSRLVIEYWISVNDTQIRKMTVSGAAGLNTAEMLGLPSDLPAEVTVRVTLDMSQFGKSVDVQKPNIRCLLYTSPSPRDATLSRMPSSA